MLRKFVFKPYLAYVAEQEIKQKQIDEAADTIARIREEAEKEANKVIALANAQAFEIRNNAKSVAQEQADQIVADAQEQASIIQKKAQKDIETQKRKVEKELKQEALGLALAINKKLFKSKSKANAEFITSHTS